jgi:hypothetical protein
MPSTNLSQSAVIVIALGMCVSAATCHDDDEDEDYKVHAGLEDVQIAPKAAATAQSASRKFQLFAWYRGKSKNVMPGPGPLTWSMQLNGGTTNPSSGEVTISAFPTAGSRAGEARVGDGSDADTVKVKLWANAAAATSEGDVLEITEPAAATGGPTTLLAEAPSIALLESRTSAGGCRWSDPFPFMSALSVGEQTAIPCSLALFFPRNGMLFQDPVTDPGWLQKGARFSLAPKKRLPVRITVFLAVTQAPAPQQPSTPQPNQQMPDPKQLAELDVERANLILEESRAGLQIEAEYKELPLTSDLPLRIGADPYDCVLTPMLPSDPNKDDYSYNPYRISVYYVDRINYPPDPVHPRVRGVQCHHWYSGNPTVGTPPGSGPVVFISYSHHSPVTLAHEIGHALGLNDVEERLGNRDVMHNLLPDGPLGADARSHLTIGQVFRMNVWDDSWINTRTPKPLQRACDTKQPCPEEETDPDGE